ncbi:hypothetical protein GMSM_04690 [Geomonas sp. Red276]
MQKSKTSQPSAGKQQQQQQQRPGQEQVQSGTHLQKGQQQGEKIQQPGEQLKQKQQGQAGQGKSKK